MLSNSRVNSLINSIESFEKERGAWAREMLLRSRNNEMDMLCALFNLVNDLMIQFSRRYPDLLRASTISSLLINS
ncbi:MAG: hypothetical protein B6D64_08485 [Bacteroidetes bacterium 4484_276]|nr:MAG: hypothetical protein B6D64_08485 [Bacteroidetes bacterium 4484_276]